jgi:hypothetical protein
MGEWVKRMPALLLCAVALGQIVLAKRFELMPWKGGGFGMFATIDGFGHRDLRYVAERPGAEEVEIAGELDGTLIDAALAMPTDSHLLALARALGEMERPLEFSHVRVELWRTRLDGQRLVREKVKVVKYALPVRKNAAPPATVAARDRR